jgi:glycosyltransferase involved in cell wall biosynthesis
MTSALTCETARMHLTLFVSSDGHARPAQNLALVQGQGLITPRGSVFATVTLSAPGCDDDTVSSVDYAMWIDDHSSRDDLPSPGPWSRKLFNTWPVVADFLYQRRIRRGNRRLLKRLTRIAPPAAVHEAVAESQPGPRDNVILFCLYWLDFGGAENFALTVVQAAHARGYRVIVFSDQVGRHRIMERFAPFCEAIYATGNFGTENRQTTAFLRLCRLYKPAVIHIHHCWAAYKLLAVAKAMEPAPAVIDTNHLLEHRTGGFVVPSVQHSGHIDLHHVISRDLADTLARHGRIEPGKIAVGKLHEMSRHHAGTPGKWAATSPLRVAFVGRLAPQKRPYLFLCMVRRLMRRFGGAPFHFTLLGDGSLQTHTRKFSKKWGVAANIEFLPGNADVGQILADAHIVLLPSQNEGLALVSYEAVRADCLVISTDVGAQREITIPQLLVPREPLGCIRKTVSLVSQIANGNLDPAPLLAQQTAMLEKTMEEAVGSDVCLDFYARAMQGRS